jgi:hypothetical protein
MGTTLAGSGEHNQLNLVDLHKDVAIRKPTAGNDNLPPITLTDNSAGHGNDRESKGFLGAVGNLLGVANVAKDLSVGAWNEVKHHPGEIFKDAAIGAAFGAAAVVAPEVVLPLAAGMLAEQAIAHGKGESLDPKHPLDMLKTIGDSIVDPGGDAKALVKTGKDIVAGAKQLGHDVKVDFAPGGYSEAEREQARADVQGVGAFAAEFAAGVAGGMIGGWAAGAIKSALASDAAATDSAAANSAKVSDAGASPAEGKPETMKPAAPADMTPEQIKTLVADRADNNGVLNIVKSGDVEYNVEHIDAATDPHGRVFSSSERSMTLQNDISVQTPDGVVELKAGTKLPNGVQFSPAGEVQVADNEAMTFSGGKLVTPDGGVTLPDGTVLTSGNLITGDSGSLPGVSLDKGALARPGENILQRQSLNLETGEPRIDTYAQSDATLSKKMVPKAGSEDIWTPKVDPEHPTVVKAVPMDDADRVSFMASYNEQVSNSAATHVVVSEGPDGSLIPQYLLSKQDAWETYGPADTLAKAYFDAQIREVSTRVGFEVPHAPANEAVMRTIAAQGL